MFIVKNIVIPNFVVSRFGVGSAPVNGGLPISTPGLKCLSFVLGMWRRKPSGSG